MYYTEKQLIEFGQMVLNRVTENPENAREVTDADVENFKEAQPKSRVVTNLRRYTLSLCTAAEKSIYKSIGKVEDLGADERLTGAVVLLDRARTLVADFVDEQIKEGSHAGK